MYSFTEIEYLKINFVSLASFLRRFMREVHMENETNYSGLAVITGASSGIGFELAKKFAENGFDLIVVAEDEGIIEAANTFEQYGVEVIQSRINLASAEGVEEFYEVIKSTQRPVDAICLNAGVGVGGASFDKTDLQKEMELIKLNVLSTVHLTKLVLKDMLIFGQGKILFTSSVAAFMPGPYESVYSASKAFVQSFAEALHEENKDKGIVITSLQPGPTETNFFHRAGMDDTKVGGSKKADPADVAEEGFNALMKGEENRIAGLKNRIQANIARVMPQSVAAKMHKNMTLPNSTADM